MIILEFYRIQIDLNPLFTLENVHMRWQMIISEDSYIITISSSVKYRDHGSPHSEYTRQDIALSKTRSPYHTPKARSYVATRPPSSTRGCPVTKDEASEHSQTTASAISAGAPSLPIGIARSMIAPSAGFIAMPACTIAVSV